MSLTFNYQIKFDYGISSQESALIRRIIAHNPSPFTFHGTGTYIIGTKNVAVIDPGPNIKSHINALLHELKDETVSHILITHTHIDHSPAAKILQEYTGAKTYGFGPHKPYDQQACDSVEEGADYDFVPDCKINDGDIIDNKNWSLKAIHTPGHCSNHISYRLEQEKALFTGDHVMGWSTTVIAPPDGNMNDYLNSLKKILHDENKIYWPTHGPSIKNPAKFVKELLKHREERELAIVDCIKSGNDTIDKIVKKIYKNTNKNLHKAAGLSVLAHINRLINTGKIQCEGSPTNHSKFEIT